ncbi:FAD-dependent oxidoreductase [Oceaniglobus roseus]|uniref:FAD-dependent oxidoreductase n=1 Tax=Oceaniglobus roseus TaxID=1737570 RepID=UPI000C7E917C|nr:FAD-dependent oxidoreductase [Kandeliimicrobium roseum]
MPEHDAARLDDLEEGKPHGVELDGVKVVLVRDGDAVHALAGTCPHRGVPLKNGIVHEGSLVCPAHRARFALATGALEAPPACEALARYPVRVVDGAVLVTVESDTPQHPLPDFADRGEDARSFVIVGSGAAGWRAAETLRREGFGGTITVVSDEDRGPLDRVELSKSYLKGEETPDTPVTRKAEDLDRVGVTWKRDHARAIDTEAAELVLANSGERVRYDRLLVATGSDARHLGVSGEGLTGIHSLRTLADADALRADLDTCRARGTCRIAIVGGGFIGLEAATVLGKREGVDVTVILNEDLPLARVFGNAVARRLLSEHEEAGVRFVRSAKVTGFTGDSRVAHVCLESGEKVDADLVLVSVGAAPRTSWLPFARDDDGGITVDETLAVPGFGNVFLAGDIARLPTPWGKVRIEHWRFAQETGELAARNMLGQGRSYDSTPFFWTMQQAKGSYAYTGHATSWDTVDGAPDGKSFALRYVEDGKVHALLSLGFQDDVTLMERRMAGRGPVEA